MILLRIICPKAIPNRKSNWGYRVRCYHWLLLRLLPLYKRCAVSDTLNLGEMQVVHNVRDYWYEKELQRFHIDTASHIERQNAPYNVKRKNRRSSIFRWSESLLVFYNGKSYSIKWSDIFSIETELDGQLKVSTEKDFILRSDFVARLAKQKQNKIGGDTAGRSVPKQVSGNQPRQKVSVKDTVPSTLSYVGPATETVKYRGFEENSIF